MIDTVYAHIESAAIVPRKRTTSDDLEFAATWLEAYEGDPEEDSDNLIALASVARKLRLEASRRNTQTQT